MPLIRITGEGLSSIALLTGILWGCIFVEQLTLAQARADGNRALEQIRVLQLKKRIVPAASPALPHAATPAAG